MQQVVDANGTSKESPFFVSGLGSDNAPSDALLLCFCSKWWFLRHRAADCRGLFLGRANVHGLAALDDGSATVDSVKGAADAVGGDVDVGYA